MVISLIRLEVILFVVSFIKIVPLSFFSLSKLLNLTPIKQGYFSGFGLILPKKLPKTLLISNNLAYLR